MTQATFGYDQLPEPTRTLFQTCGELMLRGQATRAAEIACAATRESPDDANGHYLLGGIHSIVGELARGLAATQTALRLNPVHAGAHANLGAIRMWQREYAAAIPAYRRAIELNPAMHDAQSGLAHSLLASGQFDAGWEQHERSRPLGMLRYDKAVPPLWDGRDMPGGALTIFCEAGLGDMLQFCRLVPHVRRRVGSVTVFLQPYFRPVARILRTLRGVDRLSHDVESLKTCTACISMFSLPYILRSSMTSNPTSVPYLHVDRDLERRWQYVIGNDRNLRVGLAWGGNPRPGQAMLTVIDRRRSVPFAKLARLFEIPGISFYSLQKGEAAQELVGSPVAARLIDHTEQLVDFAETAALMSRLDLIITVDTSVAHLAGAIGAPVWMLNRYDSCWRWGPTREDAPWYPTMRIFRQPGFGDWDSVIARVDDALRALAGTSVPARA